jgi:hypothetical protein
MQSVILDLGTSAKHEWRASGIQASESTRPEPMQTYRACWNHRFAGVALPARPPERKMTAARRPFREARSQC